VKIGVGKRMTLWTMRLGGGNRNKTGPTQHVFEVRDWLQVIWVYAPPHAAQMV
jgi:hypothetical protein